MYEYLIPKDLQRSGSIVYNMDHQSREKNDLSLATNDGAPSLKSQDGGDETSISFESTMEKMELPASSVMDSTSSISQSSESQEAFQAETSTPEPEQEQEKPKTGAGYGWYRKRKESDPRTWDPLLTVEPKIDPNKEHEPFSKCPHCRSVEEQLLRNPKPEPGDLPPTRNYRFSDRENRLPALEQLPPTRHYRFDTSAEEGTARVYPDRHHNTRLRRLSFPCMIPFIIINLAYLAWLIADLCYSYGPWPRYKSYFTSSNQNLNRGMEIFAGIFIFLTNAAVICHVVFGDPKYISGGSFSFASSSDQRWVAKMTALCFVPIVMLIIVVAMEKNVPMVLPTDPPVPDCHNMGYSTTIQFRVLDHAAVRGNHTNMFNSVSISNATHSGRLAFDQVYDPESSQTNNFVMTNVDGDIRNVTMNFYLQSRQYTVNWHSANETHNYLPEYFGGSWQDSPNFGFPSIQPELNSKKMDKWQLKAFQGRSYLELYKHGQKKKSWYRTLDRDNSGARNLLGACTMGGVEDIAVLVPSGVLLIEFAKDVYDTTDS